MIKTLKMEDGGQEVSKQWGFRFLRSPVKVLPGADGKRVAGIRLAVNKLEGSGEGAQAIPTGHTEDLECGMVICSIGYKSLPIDPALLKARDLPRPRKRLTELMIKTLKMEDGGQEVSKQWGFRFLRSPVKVLPGADGKRVAGIRLAVKKLEGSGEGAQAIPTGHTEDLECGMVICSIGYKSLPIDPAVPFDPRRAIVQNNLGRVQGTAGLYCSGWLKRGPTGVIATTMNDSFDTARIILNDLEAGTLDMSIHKPGAQDITALLKARGVREVSFSEWEKINSEEVRRGEALGKPREKLLDVEEMLAVAWS